MGSNSRSSKPSLARNSRSPVSGRPKIHGSPASRRWSLWTACLATSGSLSQGTLARNWMTIAPTKSMLLSGAGAATHRKVSSTASSGRYIVTPSQIKECLAAGVVTCRGENIADFVVPEVDRNIGQIRRDLNALVSRMRRFLYSCVDGWSTSNMRAFLSSSISRYARVSKPAPRITTCSTPSRIACSSRSSMKTWADDHHHLHGAHRFGILGDVRPKSCSSARTTA